MKCPKCGSPVEGERIDEFEQVFCCSRCGWGSGKAIERRQKYTAQQAAAAKPGRFGFWNRLTASWLGSAALVFLLYLLYMQIVNADSARSNSDGLFLAVYCAGVLAYIIICWFADPYGSNPLSPEILSSLIKGASQPDDQKASPKAFSADDHRRSRRLQNRLILLDEINWKNFIPVVLFLPGRLIAYSICLSFEIPAQLSATWKNTD